MPQSSYKSPQAAAREILELYFSLQRVAFGSIGAMCGTAGWSFVEHAQLSKRLGDGCHNLAEIAAGNWGGAHKPASEDVLTRALQHECRWLYEIAEGGLRYPECWTRHEESVVAVTWRLFWRAVAAPLGVEPVYGVAFSQEETKVAAIRRIRSEASRVGVLRIPTWWWLRLLLRYQGAGVFVVEIDR